MNNFARALRLSLRHRLTLAASVVCALAVAVLWGANISAIYPCVEVVMHAKTLPEWADDQIATAETKAAEFRAEAAAARQKLEQAPPDERDELEAEIHKAVRRVEAEQAALAHYRAVRPYLVAYMPTDSFQTLLLIIAAVWVGTILKVIFVVSSAVLVARLANLTALELRKQFYRRTLEMDMANFSRQRHGDLMNRFTADMNGITSGIQTLFGRAVREPLKMVVCLVGAAAVCWRLLLLSLVIAPLAGWLMNRLAKSLKRANRRAMEEMSQIYNTMSETISGIKVIKAFTTEPYERSRFHQTAKDYFRKAMKIARYDSMISPLTEIMGLAMISMAILVGGYLSLSHETHLFGIRISDRRLELGHLMLFWGLLIGLSDPVRKLSDVFGRLQKGAAAADRFYEVLDREPEICDPPHPRPLARGRELAFDGVHFSYEPGRTVLEAIDLKVAFGESIAIVGPNGCGKSTLANLVLRFFDPERGRVTLDGVDLREVRLRDLRRQIGLVNQETLLFDDTVAANIRYGSLEASDEQVIEAARQAHAHRFIDERLADGYQTRVGPGGNRLSGGQRQRIALARAILRDPPIMILDEATSQIDLESEQLIHQALGQFMRGRTTIIITHRLSTLSLADRIVVMDHGRILDAGTHAELNGRCDFYRRLNQIDWKESA